MNHVRATLEPAPVAGNLDPLHRVDFGKRTEALAPPGVPDRGTPRQPSASVARLKIGLCIDAINGLGDDLAPKSLSIRGADGSEGRPVAKGHECPKCGRNTLQPYTTNQLKCTRCDTIVKRD